MRNSKRLNACLRLGELEPEVAIQALEPLLERLVDPHGPVRVAAMHAIAKMGTQALPRVLEAFAHEHEKRESIRALLSLMGESTLEQARVALEQGIPPEDSAGRAILLGVLAGLGTKVALILVDWLKRARSDPVVFNAAKQGLLAMGAEAVPAIEAAIHSDDQETSECLAETLASFGNVGGRVLIRLLGDPANVRLNRAGASGIKMFRSWHPEGLPSGTVINEEETVSRLLRVFGRADEALMPSCAWVLGIIGSRLAEAERCRIRSALVLHAVHGVEDVKREVNSALSRLAV